MVKHDKKESAAKCDSCAKNCGRYCVCDSNDPEHCYCERLKNGRAPDKEQAVLLLHALCDQFGQACRNGSYSAARSIYAGLSAAPEHGEFRPGYLCELVLWLWRERDHPRVCRWLLREVARREVLLLPYNASLGREYERADWQAIVGWWVTGAKEYPPRIIPGE